MDNFVDIVLRKEFSPETLLESIEVDDVLKLVNRERGTHKLRPLKPTIKLMRAAKIHARNMASLNQLDHILPGSSHPKLRDRMTAAGYDFQTVAENIGSKFKDAPSLINAWMHSPNHRKAILTRSFTETGVAVAQSRSGITYVCQVFGQPEDDSEEELDILEKLREQLGDQGLVGLVRRQFGKGGQAREVLQALRKKLGF